jgi:hypothetical protein
MDKYEELYNLSKYLLNHEIDRQKRLDEKASKYLAVITILVGGYGFFANHLLNEMTPLRQWVFWEWALGIAIVSVLAALVITWVIIFKSLKTIELHQMPMNDEMITFFDTHRPVDILYALSKGNKKALLENRKKVNQKAQQVSAGYKWTAITVAVFLLLVILFGCYKLDKCNRTPPLKVPDGAVAVEMIEL